MKSSFIAIILIVMLAGQVFFPTMGVVENLPLKEDYASGVATVSIPVRSIAAIGIVLAVASLAIGGYQVATTTYGQDEHPKADITYTDIVDESGNGIQVGDYFYVEGTVYFYTGGEPKEEGRWHIKVSTSDGKSEEKTGKEDGNREFSIPFSWRFQAINEGNVKITVEAWVKGHYDRSILYSVQEETVSASPVERQRTIVKPYAWNRYEPDPSKVFHLEKSRAENEVQSLITGLSGRVCVDDVSVQFSELGIDEKAVATKEKRHYDPHIFPTKFSFLYRLYVYVDLHDGSRWEKQLSEQKEVECTLNPFDLFDTLSRLSRIEWGNIEFKPIQPLEGEQIAFNFNTPDPAVLPVPPEEITFTWDLGDGTTDEGTSLKHTYEDEGLYLVRVTAMFQGDPIGLEEVYVGVENAAPTITSLNVPETSNVDQTVYFISEYTDLGNYDTIKATWYFDDDTNATGFNVSHTFNTYGYFGYNLIIEDIDDGFDIAFGSLLVRGQQPTASTGGPYTVKETFPLVFDGSGSSDPDGQLNMWMWDFGDGTQGYGNVTTHTFMHAGTYNILLTVVDDNGLADTDSTIVTVLDVGPKIIEIDVNYNDAFNVTIVGAAIIPEPNITLNYAWNLGDGTQITGESTVTHVYHSPNTYVITLTVDDGDGHDATATKTITISTPPPLIADLQKTLESMQAEIDQMRNILYIFVGVTSALMVLLIMVAYFTYIMWKRIKSK